MPVFKNLTLNVKIALLGAGSVLLTAVALVSFVVWQSHEYNSIAQREVDTLINADLDHITRSAYNLVRTEDEAVQFQVKYNLNVAQHILQGAGKIFLSSDTIEWKAANQFSGAVLKVRVPKMLLGGRWIGINDNPDKKTNVVDDIKQLVGESATIFQRINENGDMLRIATTITNGNNKRAIGTYIPAVNSDGTENMVVSSVLQGQTFHGRAYVVNSWYLTAYAPIKDITGKIEGMIYVGIKQKTVESRIRQAILQTKVGKTGYVYVLGGKNEDRGHYIISQRGERDGENIWNSMDSDSSFVIRKIIDAAVRLKPGELATIRYRWQNPEDKKPRWKIACLAYYEPWDWVIGTGVYEDELQVYSEVLKNGRVKMINIMIVAGVIITFIIALFGFFISWSIIRPLREITIAAETISRGKPVQMKAIKSNDEIGKLSRAFNLMVVQLKQTLDGLYKSEQFLNNIIENIPNMIFVKDANNLRYVRFNKAGEELLGYSRDELNGRDNYDFFTKEDADFFTLKDREVIDGKQLIDIEQETIQTKYLGRRIIHTKKIPLFDEAGEPRYLLGISEDITERKSVEEKIKKLNTELEQRVKERTLELEIANKELETFAYSVSHDLRAPLRIVNGFSSMFLDEYADSLDEIGRNYIERIIKSTHHMGEIIDGIMLISRVKRNELSFTTLNLSDLAVSIIDELKLAEPERKVNFVFEKDLFVFADFNLMKIALTNLINNAWKYSSTKSLSEIEFGTINSDNKIIYFVKDNGVGFNMAYANNLFVPFKRLHNDAAFSGTGVGLATVMRIIQRHGGDIWAESEENKGATFFFTIPPKQGN